MKVIKKINNNVALCIDQGGKELIALGKGIGFKAMPYELQDLSGIERTFYAVKTDTLPVLDEIDEELFADTGYIVSQIRQRLKKEISDSLFFVLVDHLNFAIKRARAHIYFQFSIVSEVVQMYQMEMQAGQCAVDYLNDKYGVKLPSDEAAIIAIHIVGSYDDESYSRELENVTKIIGQITDIIEDRMHIQLDRTNFNYSRFVSHLMYLLKRQRDKTAIISTNHQLFDQTRQAFPAVYQCALAIRKTLEENQKMIISDEELLYLMLHINRMIDREDCYR